jgi:hypothetical protein
MGHVCVPGTTVDSVFAGKPAYMRAVYDRILERLEQSGPVHEDAVSVGVFLKAQRKVAEVRPRVRSVLVHVMLPREVPGARRASASSWYLSTSLTTEDVPETLLELLDEAYDAAS